MPIETGEKVAISTLWARIGLRKAVRPKSPVTAVHTNGDIEVVSLSTGHSSPKPEHFPGRHQHQLMNTKPGFVTAGFPRSEGHSSQQIRSKIHFTIKKSKITDVFLFFFSRMTAKR